MLGGGGKLEYVVQFYREVVGAVNSLNNDAPEA